MPRLHIDADIRRATALPASFYTDADVWAEVAQRVFAPSWQWVGDAAAVASPGQVAPAALAQPGGDLPVLMARDAEGALRVLSNVCTHRANLLVDAPAALSRIRCGYHGRQFGLDGRCLGSPGFGSGGDGPAQGPPGVPTGGACEPAAQPFPRASDHLPVLPSGEWAGLVFAARAAPAVALDDWLAPVRRWCGWLPLGLAAEWPSRRRDFDVPVHWALVVENYLDGLHIPFIHQGLTEALDLSQYRYELAPWGVLQLALAAANAAADGAAPGAADAFARGPGPAGSGGAGPGDLWTPPPGAPTHGQRVAAYYWWFFPNLMLNVYPWGLSLNCVRPLSPTRTRVQFRSYVWDASCLGEGAGADLDRVEAEDEAVMVRVQQGLRSPLWQPGGYSAAHERGIHHFHRLLAGALAGG